MVAALRCLYRRAIDDGLITEADNPARKVAKPRRLLSTRRAVPDTRLAEINEVAAATGDDPELDTLLLRLHTETACRRGGALALRPDDLDPDQCLILLREKGETVRRQPVSPTLMARLIEHGQQRHAEPDGQLLQYAGGRPITSRQRGSGPGHARSTTTCYPNHPEPVTAAITPSGVRRARQADATMQTCAGSLGRRSESGVERPRIVAPCPR